MRIRFLFAILLSSLMLVSCDEISKRLNDSGSGDVATVEEDSGFVEDDAVSSGPRSKSFYSSLIDKFCIDNYDAKFKKATYVPGSIVVVRIDDKGNNVVEVSGTHSLKDEVGNLVNGQMFKTVITDLGNGKYRVKFGKGSSKVLSDDSYWDSIEDEIDY